MLSLVSSFRRVIPPTTALKLKKVDKLNNLVVGSENQERFQTEYQLGKKAFERGNYNLSIEHLEAASKSIEPNSRLGGEAQMWLVTAYQAAGKSTQAIELCQKLLSHPYTETRKQAKRLQYIIQAPELKRPKEWMSEIPDLAKAEESESKYVANRSTSNTPKKKSFIESEPVDLDRVNTKDNQFIWIALLVILLILAGLFLT